LVAVELQLRSDFLFPLHSKADGIQHQVGTLTCSRFVGNDAVVKQIPNHRQIKNSLAGMDVRDIRDPFVVGSFGLKLSVQQILIFMKLLSHLSPFSAAANFGQKFILLHNPQNRFRISVYFLYPS